MAPLETEKHSDLIPSAVDDVTLDDSLHHESVSRAEDRALMRKVDRKHVESSPNCCMS